jgi:ketosteroid isomerase-like protein
MRATVILAVMLGSFVQQHAAWARNDKNPLLQADRDFYQATSEKGLDGWMSFLADDAARLPKIGAKFITGREAVRAADALLFADPNRKLTWEPVDAHLFADGKSGVTSGRYKVISKDAGGADKVVAAGGYVTGWRLDANGKWKVIFDTGSPDAPAQQK